MLDSQLTASRVAMIVLLAGTLAGVAELRGQSATPGTAVAATQRRISFTTSEGTSLNFDMSPDGRWIVFDLLGQLWRIPAEGGEAARLTDAVADAAEDVDPTVSPDGRWIAFQGDRNGVEGLWLMPTGGGAPRLLRGTEASPQQPSAGTPVCIDWLPDGQLLALVRPRGAPGGALRFIDPGSGQAREVPAGGPPPISTGSGLISACPASSPDGSKVAVFVEDPAGVFQLHVLPLAAGEG